MVYGLNESKPDFFQNTEIKFAKELNIQTHELEDCLADARIYAEKGIIDGMSYELTSALKYSRILDSDISMQVKEIRELALKYHEKFHSLSDLLMWVEDESKTVKPIFLSNVLGYAKSVADIFEWSIEKELEPHYKILEKHKAQIKALHAKELPKNHKPVMIRIAGYADL